MAGGELFFPSPLTPGYQANLQMCNNYTVIPVDEATCQFVHSSLIVSVTLELASYPPPLEPV